MLPVKTLWFHSHRLAILVFTVWVTQTDVLYQQHLLILEHRRYGSGVHTKIRRGFSHAPRGKDPSGSRKRSLTGHHIVYILQVVGRLPLFWGGLHYNFLLACPPTWWFMIHSESHRQFCIGVCVCLFERALTANFTSIHKQIHICLGLFNSLSVYQPGVYAIVYLAWK